MAVGSLVPLCRRLRISAKTATDYLFRAISELLGSVVCIQSLLSMCSRCLIDLPIAPLSLRLVTLRTETLYRHRWVSVQSLSGVLAIYFAQRPACFCV